MKKVFSLTLLAFLCTGATCWKPIARGALDLVELTCILEHDEIQDERALAVACAVSEDLLPELRKILAAKKAAAARKMGKTAPSASASSK